MELANHGVVLLKQLNAQREFGFLCDCTVAIGDVFFKAHKAVLAAFSNYFRMLFVHQGSDCVRLKPADIQPEIFSYLLNLMYTGKLSPQLIDPLRLEQGVKFLHAFPLLQGMGQVSPAALSHSEVGMPLATSLYGIQISDQPSQPFSPHPDSSPSDSGRLLDGRWALGESGPDHPVFKGDASADQFTVEAQGPETRSESPAVSAILRVKPSIMRRKASTRKHYSCHLCGSRFSQRAGLAEHLLLHAQALLPEVWASPSGSAASPAPVGFIPDPPLRGEESPRGAGDDGEGPPAADSPGMEVEGFRADTPPPSDIADIDNLEGTDLERGTRRRRYECATCGRKFIQKSHWREHTYIHTGKPYRCSACGKSFCRAKQAARHACLGQSAESYTIVDRHSVELCASEDSNQMETLFLDSSRPYKCNVCESTLSSPDEILKHPCFSQNAPVLSGSDDQITLHNGGPPKNNGLGSSNVKPIKSEEVFN
ncbi:zinc finger and BTB domain-containing protein 2a [Anguilla anguilla]|uniref:zinc finger and BTB domain-containing protein 2a n=1 Tax=Anguilla anguilla TaxID=7936 RepID=UPI0015B37DCB|nr:zinc finger and BTB domain-containing protein 2a [Anguilla anguilla]